MPAALLSESLSLYRFAAACDLSLDNDGLAGCLKTTGGTDRGIEPGGGRARMGGRGGRHGAVVGSPGRPSLAGTELHGATRTGGGGGGFPSSPPTTSSEINFETVPTKQKLTVGFATASDE